MTERKYLKDYIAIFEELTGQRAMYEDSARRWLLDMCKVLQKHGIIDGCRIEARIYDK